MNYDEIKNSELRKENSDMVSEEREIAHLKSEHYKSQIREAYNKRVKTRRFEQGDLVLRRADELKNTGKLELNWDGPYIIVKVLA